VTLESLPVDANGKLDRRALPDNPDAARAPYVAPRDALERDLARIWEAELGVRRVGVHDDFFDLGGDSLTAASVASRMVKTLRLSAAPEILFAAPSVAELASLLRRGDGHRRLDSLVALAPDGDRPPIFFVPAREVEFLLYSELARRLGAGQPSYVYRWTLSGDGRGLPSSVEEMAAEGVEGIRRVQPRGPYRLGGFCFGGVVALEMARQIRESGEEVASLALIQVSPYDFPGLVAPAAVARYRQKRRRETPPERRARRAKRLGRGEEERTLSYVSRLGGLLVEAVRSQGIRLGRASASRARDLAWKAACRGLEALGRPVPLRLRDPERMVARVFGSYRARPDVGRVAVFLPRFSREAYSDDPERDFAGLSTGTLTLSELPCRDGEMLLEPHVSALARNLSDLLSEVAAPFPTNGQPRRPGL